MTDWAEKKCAPCKEGTPPIAVEKARSLLGGLKGWVFAEGPCLRQDLLMKDFLAAVAFIGTVAVVAEAEDHHPDIHLTGYRKLRLELSTHSIGGLSDNDFILAAKIDRLPRELKA